MTDTEATKATEDESLQKHRDLGIKGSIALLAGHYLSSAGIVLLAVILGSIASLYADELRHSFPFVWPGSKPFTEWSLSIPVCIFWALLLLVTWLAGIQARYLARTSQNTERVINTSSATITKVDSNLVEVSDNLSTVSTNLAAGVADLTTLIQTMPPKNFLDIYAQQYVSCLNAINTLEDTMGNNDTVQDQNIQTTIRTIMASIVGLSQHWDDEDPASNDHIYRANVMIYRDSREFQQPPAFAKLMHMLKFCDKELLHKSRDPKLYDGYLVLDTALTVTSNISPKEPARDIQPIALAVNQPDTDNTSPDRLVPGAPHAFFYRKSHWIDATQELTSKNRDPYLAPFLDEMEEYYAQDTRALSILSIPLYPPEYIRANPDREGNPVLAVLNIYRNSHYISKNEDRSRQFVNLITPLTYELTQLVEDYIEI